MNKFLSNFYLSTNDYTTEVNKNESSSGDLKVRKTSKTKYKNDRSVSLYRGKSLVNTF